MASVDNLFVTVSFFAFLIFMIVLITFWGALSGITNLWDVTTEGTNAKTNLDTTVSNFDFLIVMAYIAVHLGVLILAYLLRTHPVVYVVAIILIVLLAMISAPLSNVYEDLSTNSALSDAIDTIPMTNFIMDHLPRFQIIWGFITAVVLFAMARAEGYA